MNHLFAILFLLCCIPSMGDNLQQDLDNYRVPCYNTKEEYESLVGKTITYLPIANKRNFKLIQMLGTKEQNYEIIEIKHKWKRKVKGRCDWTIKKISTGETIDISVYYGNRIALLAKSDIGLFGDDEVRNFDLPFFMNIDEYKKKFIGKEYEHHLVKAKYKVMGVKIMSNIKYEPCVFVDVINSIDGSHHLYNYETASEDCFKYALEGEYQTSLVKVEKPENPDVKYGEIKIVTDSLTKYCYEDNYLRIVIYGLSGRFTFSLLNKSRYSLKLVWDDATFVDYNSSVSKIMHKGVKYSEREASQPSSTILRGSVLDDVAIPTRNIEYSKLLKDWFVSSMYPDIQINESKQVQLMLPIQIKDVVNEYVFVFEIKRVFSHPELLRLTYE